MDWRDLFVGLGLSHSPMLLTSLLSRWFRL